MELMSLVSLFFSVFNVLQLWGFEFYRYFFPLLQKFILAKWNKWRTGMSIADSKAIENVITEEEICMDEVNMVMHRLGIASEQQTDYHEENWKVDISEFTEIFLHEGPSSLEIKQAFQVFDVNGDGFIDATELQRVLCVLCMKEGYKLDECRKMVCAFDSNGDGLIDFEEFVVVMEKCFS